MDETPATAALDARRRRLLFRATHRGTRENDLLVGGFVSARIATFSEAEMDGVEEILELPDPAVSDWLTGRTALPEVPDRPMLRAMREAALHRGGGRKARGKLFACRAKHAVRVTCEARCSRDVRSTLFA